MTPQIDRNKQIVELIKSGMTYQAVGDRFKLTRQRIERIFKDADGVNPRVTLAAQKRRILTSKELESCRNLRLKGSSLGEIAKILRLVPSYVTELAKKYKWEYGSFCQGCKVHTTKENKSRYSWEWCIDCCRKRDTARTVSYIKQRYQSDPKFKKRMLDSHRDWISRKKKERKEGKK